MDTALGEICRPPQAVEGIWILFVGKGKDRVVGEADVLSQY